MVMADESVENTELRMGRTVGVGRGDLSEIVLLFIPMSPFGCSAV